MKQTTFASTGFELVTKKTRKHEFLDEMNLVVPWTELTCSIQLFAPASKTDRPPFPVATMLRIHFMQQSFGLFDPAIEETLHHMALFRGVDWQVATMPGKRRALKENKTVDALVDKLEKINNSIRAKVEHPFRVIKC